MEDRTTDLEVLHPDTETLVDAFAHELKEKLRRAQMKYGYTNGWSMTDWQDAWRADLIQHLEKGDPRDVAAYCAFGWFHGWSTTPPAKQDEWVLFTADFPYSKVTYDVRLPDGTEFISCFWPNAGRLHRHYGHGPGVVTEYGPEDGVFIRPSALSGYQYHKDRL